MILILFFSVEFKLSSGEIGTFTHPLLIYVLLNNLCSSKPERIPCGGLELARILATEFWQVWWTSFMEKAYHSTEWQRKGHLNSCCWGNKIKLLDSRQQLDPHFTFIGIDDEPFREAIQSHCNESVWCCNFMVCMASFKLLIFYRYSRKLKLHLHYHFYVH